MAASSAHAKANLEIKARCDDLEAARACAARIASEHLGVDHQVDTYFVTRSGRLKLRESSLTGAHLIPYVRPDVTGTRRSDYRILPVPDPVGTKTLLSEVLGVHRIVDKQREIFLVDNVRIHLDRVVGLGTFLELEAVFDGDPAAEAAEQRKVDTLMKELGVAPGDLLATSYEALVGGADA